MLTFADLNEFREKFIDEDNADRPGLIMLDADDTLWENMHWFEKAMSIYSTMLQEEGVSSADAMEHLYELERRNTKIQGYGSRRFEASLLQAIEELLASHPANTGTLIKIRCHQACEEIRNHPIDLLPGVSQVLPKLAERHELWLVSKGEDDEQLDKLERSGIAQFFSHVDICFEKNIEFYLDLRRQVEEKYSASKMPQLWMIDNSPRSDIEAASLAGFRTIWIPHQSTWQLEAEIAGDKVPCDLKLDNFAQLAAVFD
jgi:putative hydrolase of the HAD superfamily